MAPTFLPLSRRGSVDRVMVDRNARQASSAGHRGNGSVVGSFVLGGFRVRSTRTKPMIRFLRNRIRRGEKIAVGFVNHHFVTSCQDVGRVSFDSRQFLLVNDGIGMQIAARLRFGQGFRENMNGTDFVPRFLKSVDGVAKVYLIGGTPDVVRRAAAVIEKFPHCRVVGCCDGFSVWDRENEILDDIETTAPDILLVGLGNPLQERWVLQHWDRLNAKVIFGVGALFDWMTERRPRAPLVIRRLRLEWVYRLALEPRRLLHRYTLGIVQFFSLVFESPESLTRREGFRL